MSLRRVAESDRRDPMSRRSRSAFEGKEVTVELRATVAALMVLSAATIAAPSAAALASRRERGRSESERCILVFVLFRKCLAEVYVGWRVGV